MKIALAIPNHNQHDLVRTTIFALQRQTVLPSAVYVLSDAKPYWNLPEEEYPFKVIPINNRGKFIGRCGNRNSVVPEFLRSDNDALIFIDGDCSPMTDDFIEKYIGLLKKHDLIFGTREHSDIDGLQNPPSDILTANMDNMWSNKPIDYTDLRVVSGAVKAWNEAKTFNERLDLMLTGIIGWSCNFAFTKSGLKKLTRFQERTYGMDEGIFDSDAFKDGWGYEDVAMGIDALYAGLDIGVTNTVKVLHQSHDRSDGLFDHVKGRHIIMDRYRDLHKAVELKDRIYRVAIIATAFFSGGLITGMVTIAINLQHLLGM
jgi:hypothetical protein